MTKKDLELKIDELQKIIIEKDRELELAYQKINELQDSADKDFLGSPCHKQYEQELEVLKESQKSAEHRLQLSVQREEKLRNRIEELEKSAVRKHNERNAGRKPADEKWVASFNRFSALYESQKSMKEIMGETGMSRATYFRYKKLYEDTNTVSIKN